MMGRRLAAGDILRARQKVHLLAGRDVQNMHLRPRLARQPNEALGRAQGGDLVAPDRMRRRVAGDAQGFALVEARLVLAVEGGAAADLLEDREHPLVVRDQQAPGRGAHEHLDSRRAGQALELGEIGDVFMRAADPEGEVAMHAAFRPGELVGERLGAGRRRVGVGHFEHRGHAAEHGRARAGLQVLLVNEARLAKMDLGIDHAGKNVKAAAIEAFAGRGSAQGADRGDPAVANADVANADPVVVDHDPIDEHAIETRRHGLVLSCSGAKAAYLTVSALASATGGERMSKKAAMLEDRGVVSVTGADAAGFLQGLLTNDVERLGQAKRAMRRCSRRKARSCST